MKDLFDWLKEGVGCEYISDLRFDPYISQAKAILKDIDYLQFSLRDLSDCSEYLYLDKFTFKNYDEAIHFFNNNVIA